MYVRSNVTPVSSFVILLTVYNYNCVIIIAIIIMGLPLVTRLSEHLLLFVELLRHCLEILTAMNLVIETQLWFRLPFHTEVSWVNIVVRLPILESSIFSDVIVAGVKAKWIIVQLPILELSYKIVVRLPPFGVSRPINSDVNSDVTVAGVKTMRIMDKLPILELSYFLMIQNLKDNTVKRILILKQTRVFHMT